MSTLVTKHRPYRSLEWISVAVRPPTKRPEILPGAPAAPPAHDAATTLPHVNIGPLRIFDGDLGLASDLVLARVRLGLGARIATANMDFIAQARRSEQLRNDLANSTLVVADGAPVAWLSRLAGARRTRRVTGVDLVEEICSQASQGEGLRIAFYGSTSELAAKAADYIESKYPGVHVVTRITPPFREATQEETSAYLATLKLAKPDLVLIALGCPKQERFIAENQHVLPGSAWIGVGGTLDFFAGLVIFATQQ